MFCRWRGKAKAKATSSISNEFSGKVRCQIQSTGVSQLWFGQGFEAELYIPSTKKVVLRLLAIDLHSYSEKGSHVQSSSVSALCLTIVSSVGCAGIRVRETHLDIEP